MEDVEKTQLDTNITMWGYKGSGKTWLIQAFAKELNWYNANDKDFVYSLTDEDGNRTLFQRPINAIDTPNTERSEDYKLKFERRGKKDVHSHQVSSHVHNIIVHDNPGRWLVETVDSPVAENAQNNAIVYSSLQNSTNIIIMLDPTSVKDSPVGSTEDIEKQALKNDYERWVGTLVDIVSSKNQLVRVAVCLSKADLVKIYLPTEELVRVIFGDGLLRVLDSPNLEKRFFRVSSVGLTRNTTGGKKVENISSNGQTLRDQENWMPINVVSPFFWLFEGIEKKRIQYKNTFGDSLFGDKQKAYIPYPPPRQV